MCILFGGNPQADFYFFYKPPPTPSTLPVFTPFLLSQPNVTLLLCRSSYNSIYCTEIFLFVYKLPHFYNQIYGVKHKKQYHTKYGDTQKKSNQKNQGFSFNLTQRSFNAPTIVLRSESFFTLLNSLKCRWSPMELSPFLSVSVREKNHFMKCRGRRMTIYWRRWEREKNVQWVQWVQRSSSV